jgi:molybdopterin synthase sulfur carrier subunit
MSLNILYFASLREALGCERETLERPAGVTTAAELRAWLRARGGVWAEALADGRAVRVSIDRVLAQPGSALPEHAEIAFFPPVTGG